MIELSSRGQRSLSKGIANCYTKFGRPGLHDYLKVYPSQGMTTPKTSLACNGSPPFDCDHVWLTFDIICVSEHDCISFDAHLFCWLPFSYFVLWNLLHFGAMLVSLGCWCGIGRTLWHTQFANWHAFNWLEKVSEIVHVTIHFVHYLMGEFISFN